ncbi:MAG: SGNH/GDSL hydrolase family protein [Anaerolineales bacterium]|nr:SGNH/GDSL hydrolase family protein [Anaerolineales bacterium]
MRLFTSAWVIFWIGIRAFGQSIAAEPPVRMLALGDSYTIGAGVAVEERWPHQLASQLNARGIKAETPDIIAVTGWTTQALLEGIGRQLDWRKDYNLVSILIGVNNHYRGVPIDSYEPDLRKIIELSLDLVGRDAGKVFMLSIPDYAYTPFGGGKADITEGINAYNGINCRVAAEYNIPYVDVTAISRRGIREPGLVAGDGLHPSGRQYALWVEAIMSRLAAGPAAGPDSKNQADAAADRGNKPPL